MDKFKEFCRKIYRSRFENLFTKSLELIYMDLFGLIRPANLSGKKYRYILVDDFFRFT